MFLTVFIPELSMRKKPLKTKMQNEVAYIPEHPVKLLIPKNPRQAAYLHAICGYESITFADGPAGTGKTYLAACKAIDLLQSGVVRTIILIRPLVPAGEKIGFLPGEVGNKVAPFVEPFMDYFNERIGKASVNAMLTDGRIQIKPISFLQGKTFDDAIILLDEAENCVRKKKEDQIKLVLTRMGSNCRAIVMGDKQQTYVENSAFDHAIKALRPMARVKVITFLTCDVLRSDACREVLEAYDAYESAA